MSVAVTMGVVTQIRVLGGTVGLAVWYDDSLTLFAIAR